MLRRVHPLYASWLGLSHAPAGTKATFQTHIADLFSGCGGMSLGAWEGVRRAGGKASTKLAMDISESALSVYKANFSETDHVLCGDVSKQFSKAISRKTLTRAESALRKRVKAIDLLLAGPPCQGHSDLNNRTRRDDQRNDLYLHALRAVLVLRPKVAIIENVPSVVHARNGIIDKAAKFLTSLGFSIWKGSINGVSHGLAQSRKRHFLVASKKPLESDFPASIAKAFPESALIDAIHDLQGASNVEDLFNSSGKLSADNKRRIDFLFDNDLFDLPDIQRPDCHRLKKHSYRSVYGRLEWHKVAQTITTGFGSMGQGRFVHPAERRLITPHEAARIQGFPDFFSFRPLLQRGQMLEAIGNAVPPIVIADLVHALAERGHLGEY